MKIQKIWYHLQYKYKRLAAGKRGSPADGNNDWPFFDSLKFLSDGGNPETVEDPEALSPRDVFTSRVSCIWGRFHKI